MCVCGCAVCGTARQGHGPGRALRWCVGCIVYGVWRRGTARRAARSADRDHAAGAIGSRSSMRAGVAALHCDKIRKHGSTTLKERRTHYRPGTRRTHHSYSSHRRTAHGMWSQCETHSGPAKEDTCDTLRLAPALRVKRSQVGHLVEQLACRSDAVPMQPKVLWKRDPIARSRPLSKMRVSPVHACQIGPPAAQEARTARSA